MLQGLFHEGTFNEDSCFFSACIEDTRVQDPEKNVEVMDREEKMPIKCNDISRSKEVHKFVPSLLFERPLATHFCDVAFFGCFEVFKGTTIENLIQNDLKNLFKYVGQLPYSCFVFFRVFIVVFEKNRPKKFEDPGRDPGPRCI